MKTVFDVSRPFTQGIIEREVIKDGGVGSFVIVKNPGGLNGKCCLERCQYSLTMEGAKEMVEKKREKRLLSLKKQVLKLESAYIRVTLLEDKA